MGKDFFSKENLEKQAEHLFDSFRSPFWIVEHQWYVRCFIENTTIYLSIDGLIHHIMATDGSQR